MNPGNKMAIIKEFPFERQAYLSERMKAALAVAKKPKRINATDDNEDNESESDVSEFACGKKSQYSLVRQNNGLYGCFDGREGAVVAMFHTKAEAKIVIAELLHGWSLKRF